MTEKNGESWIEAFGMISKMHPFAFVLSVACMVIATFSLQLNTSLEMKTLLFFMSTFMGFLAIIFETYRLDREKDQKEKFFHG